MTKFFSLLVDKEVTVNRKGTLCRVCSIRTDVCDDYCKLCMRRARIIAIATTVYLSGEKKKKRLR